MNSRSELKDAPSRRLAAIARGAVQISLAVEYRAVEWIIPVTPTCEAVEQRELPRSRRRRRHPVQHAATVSGIALTRFWV